MENTDHFGMLNIGVRPTVNGVDETIEVHFFDWDKDLYGRTLEIEFLDFLREEQRFESVSALKAQLSQDKIKSYSLIQG